MEVLRRRAGELTLGEIRKLLQSPLGKGLNDVKVASLFPAAPPKRSGSGKAATAKAAKSSETKKKPRDAKGAATRKPAKTPGAQVKTRQRRGKRLVSQETLDIVKQAFVNAGKKLNTSEVVAITKLHRRTVLNALRQLREEGWLEVSKSAPESTPPAGTTAPPATTTPTDDDRLDAAVVTALSTAREPTTSTVLVKATGAPLMRVRAALHRLVECGKVTRTGIARLTRYSLAGPG